MASRLVYLYDANRIDVRDRRVLAGVRHEAIAGALRKLAQASGATFAGLHESVHRAMWAVEDAFCDWRDYGDPRVLG